MTRGLRGNRIGMQHRLLGTAVARVVVLFALLPACVDEPRYTLVVQDLDGAPLDTTHNYAVGICETDGACAIETAGTCSGSLIAPNLVLTARHCVDHGLGLNPVFCDTTFLGVITPANIYITTSPDMYGATSPVWYRPAKVIVPQPIQLCANDVALIILDKNVPASEAQPASVDIARSITPDKVAVVGVGATDVKLTMPGPGAYVPEIVDTGGHKRRIAENLPVLCQPDSACTLPDVSDASGSFTAHANHLVVGPGAFPGDSGSGIVAQSTIAEPSPVVLAVTSLGTWASPTEPNGSFGVHVSKHAALIKDAAQQAATAGGYPLPDWAEASSPDGGGSGTGSSEDDAGDAGGGGCSGTPEPPPLLAILVSLVLLRPRTVTDPSCHRACRRANAAVAR